MVAAIVFLLIVVVIGGIGSNLYLRSWVREESRREAHLRNPDTHTVAYAIPNGEDPVRVASALSMAGLTSGIDRVGLAECVRIECPESQREQVRGVLEGVPTNTSDGDSALHTRHVVFEDER